MKSHVISYIITFTIMTALMTAGGLTLYLIDSYFFINIGIKEITITENTEFKEDWKEINLNKVEIPDKEHNSILIYSNLPASQNGFEAPNGKFFYPELM